MAFIQTADMPADRMVELSRDRLPHSRSVRDRWIIESPGCMKCILLNRLVPVAMRVDSEEREGDTSACLLNTDF